MGRRSRAGALGTPLVDDDRVFAPIAGGVARFDGKTGELIRSNVLGFQEIPTLALAGSQLMASTDSIVVSYDRDTLEVRWNNQSLSGLTGGLSAGSASIYLRGRTGS